MTPKFSPEKRAMLLNKKLISRQGSQMSEEMNYTDSGLKRSKTYR